MNQLGLFSGIGGFEEAFRRAGANLVGMCEIDPQAQKVLRRHFPDVRIINDVKEIKKDTFNGIPIHLITGGFPCQDLSVAGRRAGLAGERSGLWFEYLRIIDMFRPRWVEIENVPGLLSSNGGEDFAVILRGLVELGYCIAWRVFDSQFDGVAQRRQRVFIVASLGSGDAAQVLFERESGAGDYPPSREAGQNVANAVTTGSGKSCGPRNGHGHPLNLITGTLNARQTAAGGLGTDFECDGGLQVFGLTGHGEYANRPATLRSEGGDFGGNNTKGPIDVATACNAHGGTGRHNFESETFLVQPQITHALTSEGADASEDGTGRGTPIVALGVAQTITAHQFRSNGATAGYNGQPVNLQVMAFTERTRAEGRNLETQDELAGRTHLRDIAYMTGITEKRKASETLMLQGFVRIMASYAKTDKTDADEVLRLLRNAVDSQEVAQWLARELIAFQSPEVLQSGVHGARIQGAIQTESTPSAGPLSSQDDQETGGLREMRDDEAATRRSPQRRKSAQQRSGQSDSALPLLPYEGTQSEGCLCDLWQSAEGARLLQQAFDKVSQVWRSSGLEDTATANMLGMRGTCQCEGPLWNALHEGQEGGYAPGIVTSKKSEGDRGVSYAFGVRRLTPL